MSLACFNLVYILQVICNGEEVLVCGGAKPEYIVDVWSGNHPFYQACQAAL